jgi:hypothetical protein
MATYNKEYKWNPPRRKKQRYALIERVVDFSKLPVTSGTPESSGSTLTTAWAADDILQAVQIRAGQTVLGIQVEVITRSADQLDEIQIGYGSDVDRWGRYNLYFGNTTGHADLDSVKSVNEYRPEVAYDPLYFSAADTIDIKILRAALVGKIRLIVHILEDDR